MDEAPSSQQGLALKTRGFRHGRPCAGHPRRDVHRKFKSIEPTGAEKRVEVLITTRRLTAWMPGTRPGMTLKATCEPFILAPMGQRPRPQAARESAAVRRRREISESIL